MSDSVGKIYNDFACSKAFSCFSASLTVQATHLRNGPEKKEMDCLEIFGRRVFGELSYAALLVVSLVELAVRAVLAVALIPILLLAHCCCEDEDYKNSLLVFSLIGTLVSAENALNCTVALIQNIFAERINYDDLVPCFVPCNTHLIG